MRKIKVLFVCVHNSARSQMAEALLNTLAPERFTAESAGLEPSILNPLAVEVMKEIGIDISSNKTKSVMDFYDSGKKYDYIITVCDAASSEKCPIFPGRGIKLHWGFEDPAGFKGAYEDKLERTRKLRNQIKDKVKDFIISIGKGGGNE